MAMLCPRLANSSTASISPIAAAVPLRQGLHGDDAVWMSCTCGATILAPTRKEDAEPDPESS